MAFSEKKLVIAALALLVGVSVIVTVFRQAAPPLHFTSVSVGSQSYVCVEKLRFDDGAWHAMRGFVTSGYGPPPPLVPGNKAGIGPTPFPTKGEARWFNFSQQRFYEARLLDPDIPQKAAAVVKAQPLAPYRLTLTLALGDAGDLQMWLSGTDANYPNSRDFMEFLSAVQGYEAEGDVNEYKKATEGARLRREIPLEPIAPPAKSRIWEK
jgi:hypothetical protein